MKKPKVLLIGGPTAVGKTALSFECAKLFDGEIISSDCVQVYKGLDIGSAKPTKNEQNMVPHHLIDILEPNENFNVDEFVRKTKGIILDLNAKNKLPIIVGGTGLYMQALLYEYNLGQTQKDEALRIKYQNIANDKGNIYLHNLLKKVDPLSASKLHPNDVKRVVRALEIFDLSKKPKSQNQLRTLESEYDYTLVVLNKERQSLYDIINKRTDEMIDKGLREEVEALIKEKGLSRDTQSLSGIGYKEWFDFFEGKLSLEETIEKIKQNTRNYAKRQITWFKNMPKAHWFNTEKSLREVLDFLKDIYKK